MQLGHLHVYAKCAHEVHGAMNFQKVTRSRFQNVCEPESGQAMVEFMLVVSVVFILFVSMLQTMILMHSYSLARTRPVRM